MRAALLLFAAASVLAAEEPWDLAIEKAGEGEYVVRIHNLAKVSMTAYAAAAEWDAPRNRGFMVQYRDAAFHGPEPSEIAGGESRLVRFYPDTSKFVQIRVLGAVFADGSSHGDPIVVQYIHDSRRRVLDDLDAVLVLLKRPDGAHRSRAEISAEVRALRSRESERRMWWRGQQGPPSVPGAGIVSARVLEKLEKAGQPIPAIVQYLEDWRGLVSGLR